jgi:S-adenosyl methyltransferase
VTNDADGTGIDTTVPHSARIWNYWLGGQDNYAIGRLRREQGQVRSRRHHGPLGMY